MTDEQRVALREAANRVLRYGTTPAFNVFWPTFSEVARPATVLALLDECEQLQTKLAAVERENDELQATYDLRRKADMRAISRWKEVHPEKPLAWPDHADLVVWLRQENERMREAGRKVMDVRDILTDIPDDSDVAMATGLFAEALTVFRAALEPRA